jgi:ABC-2 type transport system permease protein
VPAPGSSSGGPTPRPMQSRRPGTLAVTGAVVRNELRLWFLAPAAWVFLSASLFLAGMFFTMAIGATGEASLRGALPNLGVTLVFTLPLVTMRQLAQEARSGTLELLLTAPVPPIALVLGKWLAAVALCGVLLALTFPFPVVLFAWGDPDPGVLATSYLGLFACCCAFSAVGLLASSLTSDPMVAGVLGVLLLLPSWLASAAGQLAPPGMAPLLERISFVEHLRSFAVGVLDTGDLAWFGGVVGVALFGTWRSLESRRWR